MAKRQIDQSYSDEIPDVCQKAIKFVRRAEEADSFNRKEAIDDAKFRAGEQWPAEIQNSRQLESRPLLTINNTNSYCQQLINNYRQQRPRIKVHPVGDGSDVKKAKVIQGLVRHIEVQSDADTAYDTAVESAITIGWGYARVVHDYARPDSRDQELYIRPINNTFCVRIDPMSVAIDGSDIEEATIEEEMSISAFNDYYPGKNDGSDFMEGAYASFGSSVRGDVLGWVTKDAIRVCEYFYTERSLETLVFLSDGNNVWEKDLKDYEKKLAKKGITRVGERKSYRKKIKWAKLTRFEVLEEREWPGRFVPIVPFYANISYLTGRKIICGAVRHAKDPARMYNFERSAYVESVALAPKAKWLMADGQDEGFENEWAQANVSARPVLHAKQIDSDGRPAPRPERLQPEPPPPGIMQGMMQAKEDLQTVFGITDPAQRVSGNVSGKALNAERQQSDNSNFHIFDNATKSQAQIGRILLDLIPVIYDAKKVQRIIGDDGRPSMVTINDPEELDADNEVLNDVTVGEYDVIMETGPGYNSKRQEAVEAMMPMMSANEELFKTAGDLFFRNMDFPGADIIADRLAAANPLAQIDDKSPVPPQIQMKLKAQEQQIQQLTGQLQAAAQEIQTRSGIEQMKQDGATKRELLKTSTQAHATELTEATWRQDIEMKAITALDVAGIKAHTALLQKNLDSSYADKLVDQGISNVDTVHDEMNSS